MRAVKILRGTSSKNDEAMFKAEAEVMAIMRHPEIVALVGVCMSQRPWLVCIELMLYGDVRKVIQAARNKKLDFTFAEQLHLARQVCDGLGFVAAQGYVHMDVAARNILMHENCIVKIADFGCARRLDPETGKHRLLETLRLAVRWMGPDTLGKPPLYFSEKTDVYAFGVFLWELASYGVLPYGQFDARTARDKIKEGVLLEKIPGCNEVLEDIMAKCWVPTADPRPTFKQMKERLDIEFEAAKAFTGEPRDLGAVVNSVLSQNVRRMSRRASVARKASVVDRSAAVEIKEVPAAE